MQIANQEITYPATELVCFSKDENGELRYEGLMETAILTDNTCIREIKELTHEEYLAVDKSDLPDKKNVVHTVQMLQLPQMLKEHEAEMEAIDRFWEQELNK